MLKNIGVTDAVTKSGAVKYLLFDIVEEFVHLQHEVKCSQNHSTTCSLARKHFQNLVALKT